MARPDQIVGADLASGVGGVGLAPSTENTSQNFSPAKIRNPPSDPSDPTPDFSDSGHQTAESRKVHGLFSEAQIVHPIVVSLPGMKLVNSSNAREHWGTRRRRERAQRTQLVEALESVQPPTTLPVRVTITRCGPRRLDDDGATISAKHLRDSVARWLQCDDGDRTRVRFTVNQSKGPYAVYIRLEPEEDRDWGPG